MNKLWYIHPTEHYSTIKSERITDKCNNMDRSPEHVEQKKPGTKGHLLYDSTCLKFKNRQNQTMVIDVRRVATSLCPWCVSRKVDKETFWDNRNVLFHNLGSGFMSHSEIIQLYTYDLYILLHVNYTSILKSKINQGISSGLAVC